MTDVRVETAKVVRVELATDTSPPGLGEATMLVMSLHAVASSIRLGTGQTIRRETRDEPVSLLVEWRVLDVGVGSLEILIGVAGGGIAALNGLAKLLEVIRDWGANKRIAEAEAAKREAEALKAQIEAKELDERVFGRSGPFDPTAEEVLALWEHVRNLPVPDDEIGPTGVPIVTLVLPNAPTDQQRYAIGWLAWRVHEVRFEEP